MTRKLSALAAHLLREIAAGRNRLWATCGVPYGWLQLERLGLAKRVPCSGGHSGNDRAELTPAGIEVLKGLDR